MVLNMGPQHPSTHGVLRLVLEIDGEIVVRAVSRIGYLHTGIEKTCEAKFYQQVVPLTDRIDYLCPMTNNLCYAWRSRSCWSSRSRERAQWMRVLLAELTRINSHLIWLGTHAMDIGALTVFLYTFREREEILRIFEDGVRPANDDQLLPHWRIGAGAAAGFFRARAGFINDISGEDRRVREPADRQTRSAWTGSKGVGYLSAEDAIALGVTGPPLRASGIDFDLRRDMPYSGYENFSSTCRFRTTATCGRGTWCACRRCAER